MIWVSASDEFLHATESRGNYGPHRASTQGRTVPRTDRPLRCPRRLLTENPDAAPDLRIASEFTNCGTEITCWLKSHR